MADLLSNPALFVSGLTVYGGLIFGGLAILIFAYRRKIHIAHLFDALGLSFLLAQGIGRLGCHFSGDGDWGTYLGRVHHLETSQTEKVAYR